MNPNYSRLQNKGRFSFVFGTEGTILSEALIVLPVVTFLAVGILEFGNMFWQRLTLETGVRDAARYLSRCSPNTQSCSIVTARNIALYGNPEGTGALRLSGWAGPASLTISPEVLPQDNKEGLILTVSGTSSYRPSALYWMTGLGDIALTYVHQQRYIGW